MRYLWLVLCAALVACSGPEPVVTRTQVTVRITSSDAALQAATTQVHLRASYRLGENSWRKPVTNSFANSGLSWPIDVPVFPRNPSEASGQFEVVAEAVQNNVVLAEARAITSFVSGKHVQLELRLFACPGREPGFVCTPGCQGASCSVCNASGQCEIVIPIDSSQLPQVAGPSEMLEAGTSPVISAEGGVAANPPVGALSDAATVAAPPVQGGGGDAQTPVVVTTPDTGVPVNPVIDAGPLAECDATRPCSAGYNCTQGSCVSACMQARCDMNATCSLVSGAPACTCNRGYIVTSGTGTSVVCAQDLQCEQLGCDPNATCELGTDRLRHCACKNGYTGSGTSCTPVSCPMPTLANGTVSTSNGNILNSIATYRCSTGFTQGAGSWTRSCGPDMQWSGSQPTCAAITCPALSNPSNGTVSTPSGREYGDVATYSCSSGYKMSGASTITCTANGWSGSAPVCSLACGDGVMDSGEACDPRNPSYNAWTCNSRCERTSIYSACPCLSGQICFANMCTQACTTTASCPPVPTGPTRAYCPLETGGSNICVANGCSSSFDCAPGLKCLTTGNLRYCVDCSPTGTAPCN